MELLSNHACFGGEQRFYRHQSSVIGLPMRFAVYLPPQAFRSSGFKLDSNSGSHTGSESGSESRFNSGFNSSSTIEPETKLPALFYLAGLTCTEETFIIKAGAQRVAAELGLILIAPDTSPRGAGLPGESDSWDFGVGAGFYLDATQEPWAKHYRMESYITHELLGLITKEFPVAINRIGITGHSMGGHGALTLALRHPNLFKSVSAFSPIAAPSQCPWGEKAFSGYLGSDRSEWAKHDATELIRSMGSISSTSTQGAPNQPAATHPATCPFPAGILIDQGLNDQFLEKQLHPHLFEAACAAAGQRLTFRKHEGYDHGYYFISTFMEDHLRFHMERLR